LPPHQAFPKVRGHAKIVIIGKWDPLFSEMTSLEGQILAYTLAGKLKIE